MSELKPETAPKDRVEQLESIVRDAPISDERLAFGMANSTSLDPEEIEELCRWALLIRRSRELTQHK